MTNLKFQINLKKNSKSLNFWNLEFLLWNFYFMPLQVFDLKHLIDYNAL